MLKKIKKFFSNPDNYKNTYFIKYHLYKFFDRLFLSLHLKKINDNCQKDMFNWDKYHLHFRGEVLETSKTHSIKLAKKDYELINNHLVKVNPGIKDIHPLHVITYETILRLNPESIFELGCGHGMHLHNMQILKPELKLAGIDRSAKQIEFLRETFPGLRAEIEIKDATIPFGESIYSKYDLSFTNAVIMHIHFADTHKTALANLFNVSKKHVLMAERWKNHDYMSDILELQEKKIIKWEKIHFYYKRCENSDMYIMICSKEQLPYPVLDNYGLLPKN
ncbi:MAG: class I SAM-dependent methyltransferase [Parcubacteria group bacterium]